MIYKASVSSPWQLHFHRYWRWWPSRWNTGFQKEVWWLCFRLERHITGFSYAPEFPAEVNSEK